MRKAIWHVSHCYSVTDKAANQSSISEGIYNDEQAVFFSKEFSLKFVCGFLAVHDVYDVYEYVNCY